MKQPYESLPMYEFSDDQKKWTKAHLVRIDGINTPYYVLSNKGGSWFRYKRDIKEPKLREMSPFEAKVWAEENNAQMVYIDNEKDIRIGSVLFAWERIENYRYIPNKKIKELKGQITWDDCSEFPMVEVEE